MICDLLQPLVCDRFLNDPKYRLWYVNIINPLPHRRVIGVHTPELKSLAKQLARRDDVVSLLHGFAEQRDSLCHEECMVWGFTINAIKVSVEERLNLVKEFVPAIDNWAVCDAFCGNAKWVLKSDEAVWHFLQPYFKSAREFDVRFAVIMGMSYFIKDYYLDCIFDLIDHIDFNHIVSDYIWERDAKGLSSVPKDKGIVIGPAPYYIRMGVAWFLATALAKFTDRTKVYIHHSALPPDVIKLYIRKAHESFRTRNISAI